MWSISLQVYIHASFSGWNQELLDLIMMLEICIYRSSLHKSLNVQTIFCWHNWAFLKMEFNLPLNPWFERWKSCCNDATYFWHSSIFLTKLHVYSRQQRGAYLRWWGIPMDPWLCPGYSVDDIGTIRWHQFWHAKCCHSNPCPTQVFPCTPL